MRWTAPALALGLALAAISGACERPAPPSVVGLTVAVRARSSDGSAVAGVRLWRDGRELGTTDAAGQLTTRVEGREGTRVVLTAACPSAFRTLDERRELVLRGAALQLSVACQPLELLVALVVRVRGASATGMPLRVAGRVVGQLAADGTAHLALRARPEASLTVELDTSSSPRVEPKKPVHTFQLGKQPSVLVLEQTLSRARARSHANPPRPARGLPYRID